ncbi:helix-turn-helix domain-containing protein [Hydrogenophaga sp. ZJX-1]|uniref:helix-turn-helix domain-containing protein n=1 Tax=Hydrogenophaga sp. ZJX-1 TaxID=3404778 RepID=UPI003B286D8D
MIQQDVKSRVLKASDLCRRQGITQAQIAEALGASQSQVSRILGGKGFRKSRLLEEVCLYVERLETGVTVEAVRENEELLEALRQAWDGSAVHAKALSSVIRSLAVLRPDGQGGESKMEEAV